MIKVICMIYRKIRKENFETGEVVEYYDFMADACKKNKIKIEKLILTFDNLRFLDGKYVFRSVSLDKKILHEKERLTLEEFIFYHDINYQMLAKYLGVSHATIAPATRAKKKMRNSLVKKLLNLNIDPYLFREFKNVDFIEDYEQEFGVEGSYVNEILESSKNDIKCFTREEAKLIAFELELRNINYEFEGRGPFLYINFERSDGNEKYK